MSVKVKAKQYGAPCSGRLGIPHGVFKVTRIACSCTARTLLMRLPSHHNTDNRA
jgi:hypothetical protein